MTGTVAFDEGASSTDCKVSDVGAGGPIGLGGLWEGKAAWDVERCKPHTELLCAALACP